MPRWYDTVFRNADDGRTIIVRSSGNTRHSAEQWARRKLRGDHKVDPKRYYAVRTVFVPEGER